MVHVKSLLPDPPVLPPLNIHSFLLEREETPDHVLYIDGINGRKWTKQQFKERVRILRTVLGRETAEGGLGLKAPTMVAIFSENCMEYPTLVHALWSLAVPFAPCSAYATPSELTHSLKISNSSYIFTHANRLDAALRAATEISLPRDHIFILEGRTPRGFTSVQDLIAKVERSNWPVLPSRPVPQNHLAFVLFSSGTTGLPKAVALSHNNVVSNAIQRIGWMNSLLACPKPPPTPPEGQISTIIGCLPVYHTFGLHYYCFVPFLTPTTVIFIPKWNTDLGLSLIPKYKVTTILAVPSILHQISTSPKLAKTDMSSVIGFGSGAAYLPPTLANKLSDQVGRGVMVAHGYGLSEATMSAINMIYDGQLDGKWKYTPDCSGGLIPGMEARIVREDGTEADYEEVGELWLKGPNIAMGYYGNPKATAEAFVDGWLRTGDLFKVNEEGYFWYQDRGKDTLKVSGMQVSPMEIENSLFQHPLVKDAAVAGVLASSTDVTLSERVPRAWVVLTDQGKTKRKDQMRKELDTWVQQRLSKYKWLRGGIEFVEQVRRKFS
ncbi:hypothetical protein FRC16_000023 [Serendipita sp. 398]|nr:hypothetical protein FRC16_000023 [Serendipita sp. 398]